MKILIAEDDLVSRTLLEKILFKAGHEVVSARNGAEAWELFKKSPFDVLLTDWMMPEMDGIELAQRVRRSGLPAPLIIVITALALKEARVRALDSGADDYLAKPYDPEEVLSLMDSGLRRLRQGGGAATPRATEFRLPDMIAVGVAASTGGPPTLLKLFSGIEATADAAFFVVLHGPVWLFETFLPRLQAQTAMKVRLGEGGLPVRPGEVYLAPGGRHMGVDAQRAVIRLNDDPEENYVKPAADPLFRSLARAFGRRTIGVVATGMGRDGTIGAGYLAAAGGLVIAQDPATAILPSMPQSVIDLRIAKIISPLDSLGGVVSGNIKKMAKEFAREF
jgi:two-component system chemotaxis response regulator CheB